MFTWMIFGVVALWSGRLLLYGSSRFVRIILGPFSCFSSTLIRLVLRPSELLLDVIVVRYSGL